MFGDLPLHPLVVHFVIVGMLGAGLAQLAAVVSLRFRRWIGWVLPALAVLTAVGAKLAENLGGILELRVRASPAVHAHTEMGERAGLFAVLLAAAAVLHWLATAQTLPFGLDARLGFLRGRPVARVIGVVAFVVAAVSVVLVTLTGHTGAVAVWGS